MSPFLIKDLVEHFFCLCVCFIIKEPKVAELSFCFCVCLLSSKKIQCSWTFFLFVCLFHLSFCFSFERCLSSPDPSWQGWSPTSTRRTTGPFWTPTCSPGKLYNLGKGTVFLTLDSQVNDLSIRKQWVHFRPLFAVTENFLIICLVSFITWEKAWFL